MCFSTAEASRPVQPATITSSIPPSRRIDAPPLCRVRERVWRATETPIEGSPDDRGGSDSKLYRGGWTAQDGPSQAPIRVSDIARDVSKERTRPLRVFASLSTEKPYDCIPYRFRYRYCSWAGTTSWIIRRSPLHADACAIGARFGDRDVMPNPGGRMPGPHPAPRRGRPTNFP